MTSSSSNSSSWRQQQQLEQACLVSCRRYLLLHWQQQDLMDCAALQGHTKAGSQPHYRLPLLLLEVAQCRVLG